MAVSDNTLDHASIEVPTRTTSVPVEEKPRLVQLKAEGRGEVGRVVMLDRERLVIGRGEGADLLVHDQGVSRRHAAVERVGAGFRLVDFDSRNGTFVNNARVKVAQLRDGDRIQLGSNTLLRFTTAADDHEWIRQSLDHGGVALWDYALDTREVSWSEHTDRVLGLPTGSLSSKRTSFEPLLHADDRARVIAALRLTTDSLTPFEQEFRLVVAPAPARWVLSRGYLLRGDDGLPRRITGTIIDVTVRKQRDLELRRAANLFESLTDGVFLTDAEGQVVDLNSSAERLFAVTRAQALGLRLFELVGAADPADLAARAHRELHAHGRWSSELSFRALERSFEVNAFPLRSDDTMVGTAFLFRDTTDRKRLQSQVAFYDRLSSLGTLSAGLAHEINNPLSFVTGSLEFVLEALRPDAEGHREELEALEDALEGARRIANTVRDMKAFSRDDPTNKPAPTDARRALELALKMTQKLTSSRARVTLQLDPAMPLALATESRLSQVFINLLVNAAQAIPEGAEGHIEVRQRVEDRWVVTEVCDDGAGIPPDHLGRIFDPFFTTKPVGVGTGLGLSICHGLVTGFGGELLVRSEPGRGTTFTVRLRGSDEAPREEPTFAPSTQRLARLLLVDDEPLVLRSLSRALGFHEVTTAQSVDEALAQLERGDFDVIFCDLMMPGRTGMDLYEVLDRDHPELASRVVFVSGGAFTDRARDFVSRVSNPMLTKPVDGRTLLNLVQARLRERTGVHGLAG